MNKDFALKFSKSMPYSILYMMMMIIFCMVIKIGFSPLLARKIPYSQGLRPRQEQGKGKGVRT